MIVRSVAWVLVTGLVATAAHANPRPQHLVAIKPTQQRIVDAELLEMTNDPILARGDKVSGEERKGMVAFTFDDGPSRETSPIVIDALLRYDIPATFFIVTERLDDDDSRELIHRELTNGFTIGSHTVTHARLRRASPFKLAAEVDESIRILAKTADRPIGMFRPPFGSIDKRVDAWIKKRGLTEVLWSVDTRDWQAKDPELLRHKVLELILAQEGGVVLMHDIKPITAQVVSAVLDDLEAENCRRLDHGSDPILPVSIHYFLRDDKQPRAVPADVQNRTNAYRMNLPIRCLARAEAARHQPQQPPAPLDGPFFTPPSPPPELCPQEPIAPPAPPFQPATPLTPLMTWPLACNVR